MTGEMKRRLNRRPQRRSGQICFHSRPSWYTLHAPPASTAYATGSCAQGDGSSPLGPSFNRRDGSSVYFVCTVYPYTSTVKQNTDYHSFHSNRAPYTHLLS